MNENTNFIAIDLVVLKVMNHPKNPRGQQKRNSNKYKNKIEG
jgi:hypothetical protein